ncbi:uncharacterized protein DUF1449 [Desulfobotulus alkaliphilus]|uniref:Uncharacterized protein DUF1449 n=1 Tax=Desulfobotulus alkaliphilus TaxID=622671 RepID=A0A562RS43_9BACT|nr:YqiJ family protein [Desulfobotulus alkaliphilus]TWI71160.1 uncharacterized protein DUF1449 [Desulfobotulus alkaliphilus]
MWELLTVSENLIFTTALGIMLLIGLLEVLAMISGVGGSSVVDSLLPEINADAGGFDGSLGKFMGWLRIGKVPVLMLLVIFLASFGSAGLMFQAAFHSISGHYLPGWLPAIFVFFVSLWLTRFFGGFLHRILPKDETMAVARTSLVGQMALITLGTASKGSPAEGKAKDAHGKTHYFLVEPDAEDTVFKTGDAVLLVAMENHIYKAIRSPSPFLSDPP